MTDLNTLMRGISFGETPRWHDGRLWFADWGAEELIAVELDGNSEVVFRVPSFPFSLDWLPNGQLLIISARDQAVLTPGPDGSLVTYADVSVVSDRPPGNEIVVDGRGHVYVNGGGFNPMAGEEVAPGMIALVDPDGSDGSVRQVADGLEFPNGMAVTADNSTLIVAESYGRRLTAFPIAADGGLGERRVWAALGDGVPDGICIDAEGAVWYADVPNRRCVRVAEGGAVLATIEVDRGCFACMLGGPGGDTLFIVAQEWHGMTDIDTSARTGRLLSTPAPAIHAGWP
jgi:sugar lactone lactonase YvrE